jgi:hypothetical protein
MDRSILAGDPLLINHIHILAQHFEQSLDYFHNPRSPLVSDYLQVLRTVVGLAYTAVLADGYLHLAFEPYLARFLAAQEELNFNPKSKKRMSLSAANMVHIATLCFYKLELPPLYSFFVETLRTTLIQVPGMGLDEEIECILKHLSV